MAAARTGNSVASAVAIVVAVAAKRGSFAARATLRRDCFGLEAALGGRTNLVKSLVESTGPSPMVATRRSAGATAVEVQATRVMGVDRPGLLGTRCLSVLRPGVGQTPMVEINSPKPFKLIL